MAYSLYGIDDSASCLLPCLQQGERLGRPGHVEHHIGHRCLRRELLFMEEFYGMASSRESLHHCTQYGFVTINHAR
jgi:hypothetical protein